MKRELRIKEIARDCFGDQAGVLLRVELLEDGQLTHTRWEWIPDGLDSDYVLCYLTLDAAADGGSYQPLLMDQPAPW